MVPLAHRGSHHPPGPTPGPPDRYFRVELGGWIRTGHQGHGYLEEACRAVIPLLRERGATGLVANCQPGYASTARLVQRAGFRLDALRDGRAFYVLDFD